MAQPLDQPNLTPRFCFDQSAVRDFLRLSRASIDDTITSSLNSLLTPSSQPFQPNQPRPPRGQRRQQIPSATCDRFVDEVLFPAWQSRSDVLAYCGGVATSPDPDDPDHVLREHADAAARERAVDDRLDPYGSRYLPREGRTERLAAWVRNERMVERIVRERTWGIVRDRCQEGATGGRESGAEESLANWQRR